MGTPEDCIVCFKPVPLDGKFMCCSACHQCYHLGPSCSGIADSTFNTMGPVKREKWRCRTCRSSESRSNSASASQEPSSAVASQLAAIDLKLRSLLSLKEGVDSLLSLPAKVDLLLELKPSVDLLKTTMAEVQSSIDFLSSRYTMLATATNNEKAIKDLKAETSSLRATVSEQSSVIQHLQNDLNESGQYSRLSNLEIHGLPYNTSEDLSVVINNLAEKLDLALPQPGDILAIHRLQAKDNVAAPVLVRFSCTRLRDKWLDARGRLRTLREAGSIAKVFFNENLTRVNRELFWMARLRAREQSYRYVWVKRGKIYARKCDGAPLVRLSCTSNIEKIR